MAQVSPLPVPSSTPFSVKPLPLDHLSLQPPSAYPFPLPVSLANISASFLTSVFQHQQFLRMDNSITSIETRTIGEEGFTSDVMLITLTYQTPTPGLPERIVAKYSGGDVTAVKGAAKYILHNVIFPNEIKFFSSAKLVGCPARFPRSYFASSFKQNHFMLMEDLSFARCGDGQQEGGATFEESVQVSGRRQGEQRARRREHLGNPRRDLF